MNKEIIRRLVTIRKIKGRNNPNLKRTDPEIVELLDYLRAIKSPFAMTFGQYIESKRKISQKGELSGIRFFYAGLDNSPDSRRQYAELECIGMVHDIPMFFMLFYGTKYLPKNRGAGTKAVFWMTKFISEDGGRMY